MPDCSMDPITVPLRGKTLRGLRFNAGAPIKALALHGWLDNAASFQAMAPHLPLIDLVAIDFTGHGHSDHLPTGAHYHYLDYVSDVLELAQQLQWTHYALIAHSLGAGIAPLVAVARPDQLQALVLIDGLGPLSEPEHKAPARLAEAMQARLGPVVEPRPYPSYDSAVQARARVNQISPEGLSLLCERNLVQRQEYWYWRYDPRLKAPSALYFSEAQSQAMLKAVQCPTLLLQAEQGYLSPRAESEHRWQSLQASHPKSQRQLLAGYHHIHLDQPALCAASIQGFIRNTQ